MSNNVNEYVFCPSCGSITTPGICTQCGYNLNQETEEIIQNSVSDSTYENQDYKRYEPQNEVGNTNQYEPQMSSNYSNPYGQQPAEASYHDPYGQQPVETSYNNQYNQQHGNMYYNQNLAQPQYNTYQNIPMEPEKKKSRWWIWLLIIAGVLFLGAIAIIAVIVIIFFLPFFVFNETISTTQVATPTAPIVQEVETTEEESEEESSIIEDNINSGSGTYAYAVYPADHTRYDFSDFEWSAYANSADTYSDTTDGAADFYLQDGFSSTFGTNHDNHFGEAFIGDYFEPFVECIDENQDYGLERHFISYMDEKDGVSIFGSIAYMQFTGGTISNEEELNQKILNATANDLFAYLDGQKTYDVMSSLHFFVDSFVVYNDADKVSILLDISVVGDESSYVDSYVYALNIATKSGEILDNSQFISVNEEFAAEFRERCHTQNGTDIDGLNNLTDKELAAMLADEQTNIVFFSPYGLEFGYNYEMSSPDGYSRGWMTITMKDWMNYTETLGTVISVPDESSDSENISQMNGTTDM